MQMRPVGEGDEGSLDVGTDEDCLKSAFTIGCIGTRCAGHGAGRGASKIALADL
jgi:hypothetical protein